jgi:hypothetical protein
MIRYNTSALNHLRTKTKAVMSVVHIAVAYHGTMHVGISISKTGKLIIYIYIGVYEKLQKQKS